MPYQGPDYSNFGGRAFPNDGQFNQSGQVQGAHLQQRHGQAPPTYNTNYSQAAPQYYNQGPTPSYYRTPSYPQYLSPPTQTAPLPQQQYSPDPLQYYQAPPQPLRGTPSHSQARPRSPPQQYRQPQQQPQTQRPQAARPPSRGVQWSSSSSSARPTSASQANAGSFSRNAQQTSSQQRPYQQRAPPSPPQQQPVKVEHRTPARPDIARPPSQQRPVSNQNRPHSGTTARQTPQSSGQQVQRTPSHSQQHQQATPQSTTIDPTVLLRRVAQVEIPVQRQSIKVEQSDPMARAPKRRKSNDGKANPACEPEVAPQHRQVKAEQQDSKSLSSILADKVRSSQVSSSTQPPSIDYQTVLLSLSDEYISAAYSITSDLETAEVSEEQLDHYHSLLSTGMGCLDAVLKHYHLSDPRKEARIRLRYASLLYEETENEMEAEEILSKGISICQRARLSDLQYAMHHLLARIWFKAGKFKAAMKFIDKVTIEVEKLKMVHWIYAFRFLRVSLALQKDLSNSETMNLIRNLTTVGEVATRHNHVSVQLVASTLEALVHLRSRTPESLDQAQRAIASARTHQLSGEMASLPQIKLLLDCIDLGCALSRPTQDQAADKTQMMQNDMDAYTRDGAWTNDGTFLVPLCDLRDPAIELERDTCNILRKHHFGETVCALPLKWLTRNQVYALGFLLSGLAFMHSNSAEKRAERFLNEGLNVGRLPNEHPSQSLTSASSQYDLNRRMRILLRLYVIFAYAGRAEWQSALKGVSNIHEDVQQLGSEPGAYIANLLIFLEAVCKHGLGDLDGALKLYQSPQFKIDGKLDPKSPNVNPICVLAALNSVPIMRLRGGGREPEILLDQISQYCLTHTNNNGSEYGSKTMESALYVLKAGEPSDPGADNTIIKTKQYLQAAISAAKGVANNRLLAVVMSMMTAMFFGRIVGDQAEKSSRAGRSLARKSQDKLWMAVADNMFCNTLEKCGKISEAEGVRQEAQGAMARLPKSLQATLLARIQDNE